MGLRGPKKGAKYKPTISKEQAREALRLVIMEHVREMTEAQVSAAKGLKYLVVRSKKGGRFEPVTREQVQAGLFKRDDVIIEVWDKQPSTPAYTDLMNRALDKPAEQDQTVHVDIRALDARIEVGRQRLARNRTSN
jgi:hypothetical protein